MVIKNELKLFDVVDKIGTENLLIQVAEECSELSKAALKLHRVATGTTPVSLEDAKENLIEEMADVLVCMEAMKYELGQFIPDLNTELVKTAEHKTDRWHNRVFGRGDQSETD